MHAVAATALRLVSSMKRDWIQTGRRPAGVCGAALYLAARMHGHKVTKREILALLHVGETTVDKRLGEFAATEAGSLTPEEFIEHSQMEEAEARKLLEAPPKPVSCAAREGTTHACMPRGPSRLSDRSRAPAFADSAARVRWLRAHPGGGGAVQHRTVPRVLQRVHCPLGGPPAARARPRGVLRRPEHRRTAGEPGCQLLCPSAVLPHAQSHLPTPATAHPPPPLPCSLR